MSVSVFLPTRAGSERIPEKNTRTFAGVEGGLLAIKIEQLLRTKMIDEIVLSTNETSSLEIAGKFSASGRLRIIEREDSLAQSNTNLSDLIVHAGKVCSCEHVLWTHVTSPFTDSDEYDNIISFYFEVRNKGKDSVFTADKIQNFLWSSSSGDLINRGDLNVKWPRTQDLQTVFEINSAAFVADRKTYEMGERIGNNPEVFALSGIKSMDIDYPEDFKIAEILYENRARLKGSEFRKN